jgi:AcrR family transcriptional regulator
MRVVTTKRQRIERRTDALSKDRIVEAAIQLLDADGESALTFRSLAARLSTGSGALYWHVTSKNDLLAAATDTIIATVMKDVCGDTPREAIRAIAVGVFDAIDAHPWVGTQLAREPWQSAMLRIFEGIGEQLQELGVAEEALFNHASALVSYILGLAAQYAAGVRLVPRDTDRSAFLAYIATQWAQYDSAEFPFLHQVTAQLPHHDDRDQFLAGVDLFLCGVDSVR